MAKVEFRITQEFVDSFEGTIGFGPWSQDISKRRIANSYKFLKALFEKGIEAENLSLGNAVKTNRQRRGFLPPEFGELYANFNHIALIGPQYSSNEQNAYACIVQLPRFQTWLVCAFLPSPSPKFFVCFSGTKGNCTSRLKSLTAPQEHEKFFESLVIL